MLFNFLKPDIFKKFYLLLIPFVDCVFHDDKFKVQRNAGWIERSYQFVKKLCQDSGLSILMECQESSHAFSVSFSQDTVS